MNYSKDLPPDAQLNRGDNLYSLLGAFRLSMQNDGNLVLYVINDFAVGTADIANIINHSPSALQFYPHAM
jgi:hypothetical protein